MTREEVGKAITVRKCRSCGARVIWAVTEYGKPAILDADPVPGGNIELVDGVAKYVAPLFAKPPTFVSHFATCPQAKEWRK